MKSVLMLIKKDYRIDFRQKYPIMGIGLYVLCTLYISYLSFQQSIEISTWNSLLWIILLFASNTTMAKSFIQEEDRSLYYYYLTKPSTILISKFLYAFSYQAVLVLVILGLFQFLFGQDITLQGALLLNIFVGGIGLAAVFTMVSSLSSKTGSKAVMMTILGLPLALPVLLLSISNSKNLLLGASLAEIQGNFITLLSTIVIIIALSFILFPYSWKN